MKNIDYFMGYVFIKYDFGGFSRPAIVLSTVRIITQLLIEQKFTSICLYHECQRAVSKGFLIDENFAEKFLPAESDKDDTKRVRLKDVELKSLDSELLKEVARKCGANEESNDIGVREYRCYCMRIPESL